MDSASVCAPGSDESLTQGGVGVVLWILKDGSSVCV